MKDKNGFTLVELLAVIIILGILSVLIVPKITNTLNESEKKTNMASAQNLVKVAEYKIANNEVKGTTENITIDYSNNTNTNYLDYSGEKPEIGIVQIKSNGKVAMSVKIGDYCYTKAFNSDEITETAYNNQTCGNNANVFVSIELYRKINNELVKIDKSEMQSGDIVVFKSKTLEEKFIVLLGDNKAPENTTALLAENNINPSTGLQGLNGANNEVVFAGANYWSDYSDKSDIYDSSKNKAPGNNDYSIAYYVEMYVNNLQNIGFTGVHSGRIPTHAEVNTGGIAELYRKNGEYYWLGSGCTSTQVWYESPAGVSLIVDYASGHMTVRSIIYLDTDDIE